MSHPPSGPTDQPGPWQHPADQPPYGGQPYGGPPVYGQPYGGQPPYAQPYGQGYGQPYGQGYGTPSGRGPHRRPGTVTAAAVVAMATSGVVALLTLLGLVVFAASRDTMERELRRQANLADSGIEVVDVYGLVVGLLVVLLVWSLAGVAFGWMVLRRSQAGRVLLVVSASLAALLSLLGIGSLVPALPLLASIATIVLLFAGGANEWFSRSAGAGAGPPAAYGQDPYGQLPYGQPPYGQGPYGQPPSHPQQPRGDGPVQPPWGSPGGTR